MAQRFKNWWQQLDEIGKALVIIFFWGGIATGVAASAIPILLDIKETVYKMQLQNEYINRQLAVIVEQNAKQDDRIFDHEKRIIIIEQRNINSGPR